MPRPFSERRLDWLFFAICCTFAITSLFFDMVSVFHPTLDANSWYPPEAWLLALYADCDPMFADPPAFLRVAMFYSALVYGPLYVWFAWGFYTGNRIIRIPVLMFATAITVATTMIMAEVLFSTNPDWVSPKPAKYLSFTIPYVLMPLLMAARMARPDPFTTASRPG